MRLLLDNRAGLWAKSLLLGNFVIARGVVYIAPLVIAAVASPGLYGALEFALSIALLSIGLLMTAPLGGVTQRYLIGRDPFIDVLALTVVLAGSLSLTVFISGWIWGVSDNVLLALACMGCIVAHNVASAVSRMLGRRMLAAWADGFSLLVTLTVILLLVLARGMVTISQLAIVYGLVTIASITAGVIILAVLRQPELSRRTRSVIRIGLPMAMIGTMSVWLGVGGRIMVGLLNASALPAFGIAFRVAGLALGLQQLANTVLFVRLYTARTRSADRLLSNIYAAVAVASVGIAIAGPFLPHFIKITALDGSGSGEYRRILPLVMLQVFYWIGYAMLEMRLNRSRLAGCAIVPMACTMAGGLAITLAVGLYVSNDIIVLCWLIAAQSAAFFGINAMVLARRGLPHRRFSLVGVVGGAVLALIALTGQLAGGGQ